MRSNPRPLVLLLLLVGQGAYAQQAFELPPAPKATPTPSPVAVVVPPPPMASQPEAPAPLNLPVATPTPAVATPSAGVVTQPPALTAATPKPKPKKTPKASSLGTYSGTVKITAANNQGCVGIDQSTGRTITVIPRFKGAHPGVVAVFKGNKIIEANGNGILIAPSPGMEDLSPYVAPVNAGQVLGGAAAAAGTVISILGAIHR